MSNNQESKLNEVALRIREMREISGFSREEMAKKADVDFDLYCRYENGELDFPFSFLHKCALEFGIGITELLEGNSAKLTSYTVTRKGTGQVTAKEDGITIQNLAHNFRNKIAK